MADSALLPRRSSHPARPLLRIGFLPFALIAAVVVATALGTVSISPAETVQILLFKLHLAGRGSWPLADGEIIWSIRLPHVLGAALVGAALAVAGTLFQAILRNPLADPYVIGTAAGAQLGVSVALLLPFPIAFLGFGALQVMAFAGALGTILFVYGLARTGGQTPVVTLLLAGFVVSSFLISATSLLMTVSGRINQVLAWTLGGLSVDEWGQLGAGGLLILLCIGGTYLLVRHLDVILLGEDQARHLGVRVEALKLTAIVMGSLLTALAVTMAGVVAFVGLIVPHAARLIYGPAHRVLIPATAAGGALFLMLADLIARFAVRPTVLPLGVVTAVVGAPFFLHLLRRGRREYGI